MGGRVVVLRDDDDDVNVDIIEKTGISDDDDDRTMPAKRSLK
jgi:hypothetical protein